jgi:ATP-dependent protease ClpP protease subunit
MKRKYRASDNDEDEEESILKSLKGTNIRKVNNHIYFYNSVTESSILDLNILLRESILENKKLELELGLKANSLPIYLHINSDGGLLLDAFSTVDLIKSSKANIVSVVEGSAASAATLISVCCPKRQITSNSMMLIHELRGSTWGKYSDAEVDMKNLNDMMKSLKNIYLKHSKITEDQLTKILKKDRYWDSKKCLRKGLVDEII